MKTNILKVCIALIFLVCFNALFFILGGTEQSQVNWISYGFIHVAYLQIWVTPLIANKRKGLTVLSGSLYLRAVIYFFIELVTGLAFIAIQSENVLLALAVQGVGLAVFLVLQIVGVLANDATETSLQKQGTESAYIKTMAVQVKSAMRSIEDEKVRNSVIRCYESLNNSSVESFPELKDAELALRNSVETLCTAITGGDNTQIEEKASSVLNAIQARNEAVKLCRINKFKFRKFFELLKLKELRS